MRIDASNETKTRKRTESVLCRLWWALRLALSPSCTSLHYPNTISSNKIDRGKEMNTSVQKAFVQINLLGPKHLSDANTAIDKNGALILLEFSTLSFSTYLCPRQLCALLLISESEELAQRSLLMTFNYFRTRFYKPLGESIIRYGITRNAYSLSYGTLVMGTMFC